MFVSQENKVNLAQVSHFELNGGSRDNSGATIASAEVLTGLCVDEHLARLRNNAQGCSYSDGHKGLASELEKDFSRFLARRSFFIELSLSPCVRPQSNVFVFVISRVFLSSSLTSQSFMLAKCASLYCLVVAFRELHNCFLGV